jgi:hypothetical protein
MTENEQVDCVFDKIESAKKRPEFKTWPEFRLRIVFAEKALAEGNIQLAEDSLLQAERLSLRREVTRMSIALGVDTCVRVPRALGLW